MGGGFSAGAWPGCGSLNSDGGRVERINGGFDWRSLYGISCVDGESSRRKNKQERVLVADGSSVVFSFFVLFCVVQESERGRRNQKGARNGNSWQSTTKEQGNKENNDDSRLVRQMNPKGKRATGDLAHQRVKKTVKEGREGCK